MGERNLYFDASQWTYFIFLKKYYRWVFQAYRILTGEKGIINKEWNLKTKKKAFPTWSSKYQYKCSSWW